MKLQEPPPSELIPELSLCLLESRPHPSPGRVAGIGALSITLNAVFLLGGITLARIEGSPPAPISRRPEARKSITLIAPSELTQKAPNRKELSKQIHLDDLVSQPERKPSARTFSPPPPPPPPPRRAAAVPPTPQPSPEPPTVKMAQAAPPVLGSTPSLMPPVAPPQIQVQEKPKLAFETPGIPKAPPLIRPQGAGKIELPKNSVDEVIKGIKQGSGGMVIGDVPEEPSLGSSLSRTPSPNRQATNIELMSDPQGVDFKPYLIRVLAAVRQNWLAVVPESARFGRTGKVLLQFAISKDGGVPKLVIVLPSGTESLDRAAVAGVSASNPFPPLPSEFRGDQIRVQLAFHYNVRSR